MRVIKDEIKNFGDGASTLSVQEGYMRQNIQKLLASKLQDMGNTFRRAQLSYQSELEKSTRPKTKSPLAPTASSSNDFDRPVRLDDSDSDDEVSNYDPGFTTQLKDRMDTSKIRIAQRMQEIQDIAAQVEELGQMFNDISQMIHDQGSLLDRIDYNIENAVHDVDEGKKNITEVMQGERGFSKKLCFVLFAVLLVGAIVIGWLLLKTRR
jgi:syntaxin 16